MECVVDHESVKVELGAPGTSNRAAVRLFDQEFERRMREQDGNVTAALGQILDATRSNGALGGAIIFRFLCAFGAEARAAQAVCAMPLDERAQHAQELFSDCFQEALKASGGDLYQACEQLLQDAFCDAELNAAIISSHIAFFKEGMSNGLGETDQR